MTYSDAIAYLEAHASYELTGRIESPTIERMVAIVGAMGDPQTAYPVIHVTGTNGKGSTSQMITRLLMAKGLSVGTYASPHLERLNERLLHNGRPISDEELGEQVAAVADAELLTGVRPSYFEILTAAAFRWFADVAVDVAVVEVGLLGRWDATNVADAQVAVLTNVGIDHTEFAGPTKAHIAAEKAGIVKTGSLVVIGDTEPEVVGLFTHGAATLLRGEDFDCLENQLALGGRLLDLRTPTAIYGDVFLPLHGRHQGDNAAVALAAVEAFFAAPLEDELVREGFAEVVIPGRFEVLGHQPLVIVDGAHNPLGADSCASVFFDDFDPAGRRVLVVGCLRGRDPQDLLAALRADDFDLVVVCTAPSPRALPMADLAAAARAIGCDEVVGASTVEQAIDLAMTGATAEDAILITGSLYVVGAARPHLRRVLP